MAAMFDLTELTGARADRARTSTVGAWQVAVDRKSVV